MSNNTHNQTSPKDALLKRLNDRKYKKDYTPQQQQVLFKIKGKKIGLLQSFIVFSGLPKAGKSTYIGAAIASAFNQGEIFGMDLNLEATNNKIALFDTESSEYDFYQNIERIKKFSNCNGHLEERFTAFSLREDEPETIKEFILLYLEENKNTGCIIIDGLLDLLLDFNDVKESRKLINFLKQITKKYNLLVIAVLHLGKKDLQTLGHLGSMVDRYANSVLKIEKNKELQSFEMHPYLLRSDEDFEPISLKYFENNGYMLMDYEKPQKRRNYKDYTHQEHRAIAANVIPEKGIQYTQLVEDIKAAEACGTNISKQIIKTWIAEKIIFQRDKTWFYSAS